MDFEPVNTFLERVKKMQSGRSKEMRMTYEEAHKLSLTIAQLLAKKVEAESEKGEVQNIIISGGSLKPT